MKFKVGDKAYIKVNGMKVTIVNVSLLDAKSYTIETDGGSRYYYPRTGLIPEDIFNSPLYKAMHEED